MKFNLRYFFIILAVIFTSSMAVADHITVQGEVSGEWNTDTVLVTGDLTVPDGETLVILPGTVVEFQGSYAFFIEGSITASGEQSDSIFFRVADTTGFSADTIPGGGWRGIRFDHNRNSNDPSVFNYCRFSYGKIVSDDTLTGNGGAISVRAYDKVSISYCYFQDNFATFNGGAVSLDSADVSISNSVFNRNRCGLAVAPWGYGGAISSDHSHPDILWNVFTANSSTGIGGGLSVRYEDCNIYNNKFTGNFSALGGALGVLHIPEINYRINNNLFADNTALYFGGGVATIDASPIYINNTIAGNSATYGGGFYCKDSISPDFYNTVIWGNTGAVGQQGYLFEVFSQPDFFNCDVEGGPGLFGGSGGGEAFTGAFEYCLDADPEFVGSGRDPYAIDHDSPCIDAGSADTTGFFLPATDLAGTPRVWAEVIDMGAYEWMPVGVDDIVYEDEQVKVWPNPFREFVIVEVNLQENEMVLVEVFDLNGRRISDKFEFNFPGGKQQFIIKINGSESLAGIYFIKVYHGDKVFCNKLIKSSSQEK
jgi:predicted outer membrane repeat protein